VLSLGHPRRVFVARQPVDMRKSFDTLTQLVQDGFGLDPYRGDAFVFFSRHRNRVKILVWDQSGFWVCAKRLEQGTFGLGGGVGGWGSGVGAEEMSAAAVWAILEGIEIQRMRRHRQYRRPPVQAAGAAVAVTKA